MSDFYPDLFGGDEDAARLIDDLVYVSHLWDDLIDQDKKRTEREINKAFSACLVDIPSNPFYRRFQTQLMPLLYTSIVQYEAANLMERTKERPLVDLAYGMRNAVGPIAAFAISMTNPQETCAEMIAELCRRFAATEPFDDYRKEHLQ